MAVREFLDRHRAVTGAVTAVVLLTALVLVFWQARTDTAQNAPSQAFFTADDGRTWISDDIGKLPPFTRDGKLYYRCYVYTHDGGKTQFVSHLERHSDEAKKLLEQLKSKKDLDPMNIRTLRDGVEVKRPGAPDTAWIRKSDPRSAAIMIPQSPDNSPGAAIAVEP